MTYNQTLNKLIILFESITSEKQIPMAEKYSKMLVCRVETKKVDECCFDFEGRRTRKMLLNLVDKFIKQVEYSLAYKRTE